MKSIVNILLIIVCAALFVFNLVLHVQCIRGVFIERWLMEIGTLSGLLVLPVLYFVFSFKITIPNYWMLMITSAFLAYLIISIAIPPRIDYRKFASIRVPQAHSGSSYSNEQVADLDLIAKDAQTIQNRHTSLDGMVFAMINLSWLLGTRRQPDQKEPASIHVATQVA